MGIFSSAPDTREILQRRKEDCRIVGQRMSTLFYILVGSIIVAILQMILKLTLFYVVSFGLSIAFGVVTMGMPDDEDRFQKAGIYYIVSVVFSFIANLGFITMLANLVAAIMGILYIFSFVNAASDVLTGVDDQISISWDWLKMAYSILYISLIVAVLLAFTRVLAELALLVILAAAIGVIVFEIWMMVLLYKSGNALTRFANQPIPDDVSNVVVRNGVAVRKKQDMNAGGWQCICGKQNPKYSHTCSCGKTMADSEREKAEKRAALRNRTSSANRASEKTSASSTMSESRKNVELLKELKGLLDQGVITQEEFDAKKAELLRDIK
ncbi:MAG: SHOCT domain-containing protein [Clostridiales bacterium]|nr:SHOCT domain-containing protein [Clostridiales bacterium]